MKQTKKGFTLIELLVVIAVVGFLATATFAILNNSRTKARDAMRRRDLQNIQKSLSLYFDKYNKFPPPSASEEIGTDKSNGCLNPGCPAGQQSPNYGNWSTASNLQPLVTEKFLNPLPKDPKNNATYYYEYEPCCNQTCDAAAGGGTCTTICCKYWLKAVLETDGTTLILKATE